MFSSPAFSTPAFWSRVFQSRVLQSRVFSVPTFPKYSNDDERTAALSRISHEMVDLDTLKSSTRVQFLVNVAFSIRYSASFYFFTFLLTDS